MGFRQVIRRSTLADANELRDWRIYADFAQILIAQARKLYANDPLEVDVAETVYAFDSTTIDLCLASFPWARFRTTKGAVKLHTLLDLRGAIPSFIHISDGKLHDVKALDHLVIEPGSIYLMDRAYLDLTRLYGIHEQRAFFITRAKKNTVLRRLYSNATDRTTGVTCDQIVVFGLDKAREDYPEKLRRIKLAALVDGRPLVLLTNNLKLSAITIADLYRQRWQVEVFFKWIKQHLRIKKFYGTTENAVKSQIWIAVSTYLLVAIIRKKLDLPISLHTLLQIISVMPFEKMPIQQAFQKDPSCESSLNDPNQLILFDF